MTWRPRSGSRFALVVFAAIAAAGCSRIVILHDALSAPEHNDLGVVYATRGDTTLAAREYRRALRKDAHYARARVNLGDLEAGSGRWGRAERHYRRALRDAPDDPSLLNNLAESLLRQGRSVAEAESLAVRAVARAGAEDSIPRATLAAIRAARRAP